MSSDTSDSIQRRLEETTFIEPNGGLLTEQLIQKLRNEKCSEDAVQPKTFQYPGDPPSTTSALEGHISEAWDDLEERWDEVTRDNELYGMDVSDARRRWILKLFEELGFDPEYQQANLSAGELEANLSHFGWPRRDSVTANSETPDTIPPVLHTIKPDKDRPLDDGDHQGAVGRQQSPHDELQRYLNATEDVQWSIVTDGLKLRVLRDYYHTYTRGYVEFDLENIFTNRNYDDFRALYRICHASRFIPRGSGNEAETPIESLYQVALATGVKVGEDLQSNVVEALETLGNGFLNQEIREALEEGGQEAAQAYYQDLLRIVYRLLFLLFAEQRGMMADRGDLYTKEYSISALRERAERKQSQDHQTDLWEGLKVTFHLVGQGVTEEDLNVSGYNGGLFDDEKLEFVQDATCDNDAILSAIHNLTHVEQQGYQQRISYADLGVDEIGAVYESLLEFTPQLAETALELDDRSISRGQFYLDDRGMERKETGSYYTKPELVDELIESALKPVVNDRLEDADTKEEKEEALLDIDVCDPAVGSGAFLIAANNFLGKRLAEIRSDSAYPDEETVRQARRSVVQHCLYGVDLNPMAVELAKVSLWINSAVEDQPLSFLDHRIKQGNSLLGTTPELIAEGLPVDAYETSGGREWHEGNEVRKMVRSENRDLSKDSQLQTGLNWSWDDHDEHVELANEIEGIDEEDITDIEEKAELFDELESSESLRRDRLAHDVWTAAFYWPLDGSADEYPSPRSIERVRRNPPENLERSFDELDGFESMCKRAVEIAERQSFFHWKLEFPAVYSSNGGFDCIIGNPPWEKMDFEEQEFFAVRKPEIANAPTSAKRSEMIENLQDTDPELYEEYQQAAEAAEDTMNFMRESGRYPLTGRGIMNTYALFAELALSNIQPDSLTGMVVPTGIATDANTQYFFREIVEERRLKSLFDFENKKGLFPGVDSRYKFSLLTLSGSDRKQSSFELAFYLIEPDQLQDSERRFKLSREDIELINPNTKNCPTFESKADAELTLELYNSVGVFKNTAEERNPWSIEISRMFNTSDDSNLFKTETELEQNSWNLTGNKFEKGSDLYIPLYEAKLVNQFNHRYSTFEGVPQAEADKGNAVRLGAEELDKPNRLALPRYWLSESEYQDKNGDDWHLAVRDITNATNERTVIASIIPGVATGETLKQISGQSAEESLLLLACLNSFTLDFAARQKVGGTHLSHFILRQLPIPSPNRFERVKLDGEPIRDAILERSIRLMYTAHDLDPFAEEVGEGRGPFTFTGDTQPRKELRMELEALICHVYDLSSDDFEQLFDSFEQIRDREMEEHGRYQTRETIKQKYEEFAPRISMNQDDS
ncbi:restriction/modification enzyme [Halorhabdus utahensis DSM 12940]|uniref:site-specific DNA-methyltransferase (adenine-specific) n=1 Tax=Halorhabdus utahensis (strain DSM 12940 / JCM 11049 / AX-2) TaxID=519442 RepID=C7NQX6_HALUD|nr:DNA methyltransferase [Halorhabdus utahensis]ACV11880.1 restriction/modification enzyme [Halorhabdus utahensis DSM 12940]